MVCKRFDPIEAIIFVNQGVLEVFTEVDGSEFVLDRLHPGSCLNYRTFFREDSMDVNVRCLENCKLYYLTHDIYDKVLSDSQRSKKNLDILKALHIIQGVPPKDHGHRHCCQ